MCYEFSSLFEKVRARRLHKEQQRETVAQTEHRSAPTPEPTRAPQAPAKPRETIPM